MSPLYRQLPRLSAALAALACAAPAKAAIWVWDEFTGVWSLATNWDVGTVPLGANDTALVFGGSGAAAYTATHDLGTLQVHSLTLQSSASAAQTIAGPGVIEFVAGAGSAAVTQNGSGAFTISAGISAQTALVFGGTGSGRVTLGGIISGGGGLSFTGGNWTLTNTANTFTGGIAVSGGAVVEFAPASGLLDTRARTPAAPGIFGSNSATDAISLDGGTVKFTTAGVLNTDGTGGHIFLTIGQRIVFGANGGVVDLTNSNPSAPDQHSGTIGWANASGTVMNGGSFIAELSNTAPAVFRFNGGQLGLSSLTDPLGGDWTLNSNTLRFNTYTGSGPLRVEVTNGALVRAGLGSNQAMSHAGAVTYRGVIGGDPTSGPDGSVNSGITLTTGRVLLDRNLAAYPAGLTLEGALQFATGNGAGAIDGSVVIAGTASGAAGNVAFFGRSTGTAMTGAINEPLDSGPGQNVLWIGRGGNDTLTLQSGAVAVFDARLRMDQNNHHGVLLDATAVIAPGATLRVAQSISNFSGFARQATLANVGDIILRGDVTGTGSTAADAVLDIRLPAPAANGTTINGIPSPLGAVAPAQGTRPFGGLVAEAAHGIIIAGSGFGGLRVEANARPDALFSTTGLAGGAHFADPVSNTAKLDAYLTPARLAGITGTGGYLTPAPFGETWNFPAGGEWPDSVPVGLRVTNHHTGGVDVSLAGTGAFSHNIAVDSGATLDLGNMAFVFGPAAPAPGIGVLHGDGTVIAAGGITVSIGGGISPGMGGTGALALKGAVTLNGSLTLDIAGPAADLLVLDGSLVLGASSSLVFSPASVLGARDYTVAKVSGGISGAQPAAVNLPASHVVDLSAPDRIRILRNTATRKWSGAQSGAWDTGTQNWQGPSSYLDGEHAVFDDTDAGTHRTVTLAADFSPVSVRVNTTAAYTIVSQPGARISGTGFLIKEGAGTLTLTGAVDFTGGVTVNAGTLRLGADGSLPLTGGVVVAAGAVLDLNGHSQQLDELLVRGSVTAGAISTPSLVLDGASAFDAALTLEGILSKSGAPFTMPAAVSFGGGNGVIHVAAGTAPELTLSGPLTNGGLVKTGPGTLVLASSENHYTGGTFVNEGTLRASASGALPASGAVMVAAAGTLDLDGKNHALASLDSAGSVVTGGGQVTLGALSGTGGTFDFAAGGILVSQSAITSYAGAISGSGTIVKAGTGTLTLAGAGAFSGGVNVTAGTLRITNPAAAGTGVISVSPGGALVLGALIGNSITMSGGTIGGTLGGAQDPFTTGTLTITPGATVTVLAADPEAPAVKSDMVLAGALNGSGTIVVASGDDVIGADYASGLRLRGDSESGFSGTIIVSNAAKFEMQSEVPGVFRTAGTAKIVMEAGSFSTARTGAYSQLNLRNNSTGDTTFGNDVEITGAGLANFGPVGTALQDTIIRLGNLKIGAGQTAAVNKNAGPSQTVEFASVTLTGGEAEFSPRTPDFGFGFTSDLRLGPISENAPGSGILMGGDGVLTLLGPNTYSGTTRILRGTTRLAGANALPAGGALVLDGGTLDISDAGVSRDVSISRLSGFAGLLTNSAFDAIRNVTVNQSANTTYGGLLSGNLNFIKDGTGTLTLTGSSSIGGSVTVKGGTLLVGTTIVPSFLFAPASVQAGGTLGGSGILGDVTVAAGGRLSPGNSAGQLTTGSVTFGAASVFEVGIHGTQPVAEHDRLNVAGIVVFSPGTLLDVRLGFDPLDHVDVFTLLINDGVDAISGTLTHGGQPLAEGAQFTVNDGGFSQEFAITYAGGDGNDLALLSVPEPASATLLLGGIALLARRRRARE